MGFNEDWKKVCLNEVCQFISRGISPAYAEDNGVVVINQKCVRNNRVDLTIARLTNPEKKKISEDRYLKNLDILVNSTGVGTLGRVAQIKDVWTPMTVDSHVTIVRANNNIDARFLGYNLFMQQGNIEHLAKGSTGQTELSRNDLAEKIELLVPPLSEQKAIANILSSLDEKIELNNQMNKTLEEMAQALFKRWFVDFEFPNEEGEPYKSSGGEMVESELGMIPKGWNLMSLGDISDLITKSEKPFENKETIYEHFSLPACDEGKLPVIEAGSEISSNKYRIDNTCILISKLNPSTKRIWNPTCNTANSICSTEFIVYRPKKVEYKDFCYEVINADSFTDFLLANVTGSTGSRQRTQPKKTLDYKIPMCNDNTIVKFSNIIKPMHDMVKLNIQNNRLLKNKRDTLLPKLMSGEIRVTDI